MSATLALLGALGLIVALACIALLAGSLAHDIGRWWRGRRSGRFLILLVLFLTACGSSGHRPPAPPSLTISWTDNTGGVAVTLLERRPFADSAFAQIARVPPGVVEYVDAGVTVGERYCYRARAVIGDAASEFSEEVCR